MQNELHQKITSALKSSFSFSEFRPGQAEAITTLLTQGRLLCIQPTGHGKSLLYQLPATILDGITLVISPLLALMRDQLYQLKNRFNIPAASINTDQSEFENEQAKAAALSGKIKILFVAPEQLDNVNRFDFLMSLPIKLLVVDEAHCISTWGHDFRPSYRQIIHLVNALTEKNPEIKLLALTATANDKTELDIQEQLSIKNQKITIHRESMNRANIRLTVISISGAAMKLATLTNLLNQMDGTGLIYCATRENTEMVASYLSSQNIKTIAYHAGLDPSLKNQIQNDFIKDEYKVITATNALGMGIDKSNLRFIIHFDFPGSITAYYQEVGRAGRDGLHADGILLYDPVDSKIQKYFIDSSQPTTVDFQVVLNTIISSQVPINLTLLKRLTGLHPTRLVVITSELIEQGFLKKSAQHKTQIYQLTNKKGLPNLKRYSIQYEVKINELRSMQRYAEHSKKCLMSVLRKALGDIKPNDCNQCSVCRSTSSFKSVKERDLLITIDSWLERRTVPISLSKKINSTYSGLAVLDGKLRAHSFAHFMKQRATSNDIHTSMPAELLQLIKKCFKDLNEHYQFSCIVPLPSRTWHARDAVVSLFAELLKVPVFLDFLKWKEMPYARQGELLNNEQRLHNVSNRMQIDKHYNVPNGAILLLDDYIGSGATLNEAARTLRENGSVKQAIIPFTIAAVKWRLGNSGMI